MPAVTVTRTGLSSADLAQALTKQLGSRYKVVEKAGHPGKLKVSTSAASTANVAMSERPNGTHVGVHGGGFIIGRLINELFIARTVAKAISESPDLNGSS